MFLSLDYCSWNKAIVWFLLVSRSQTAFSFLIWGWWKFFCWPQIKKKKKWSGYVRLDFLLHNVPERQLTCLYTIHVRYKRILVLVSHSQDFLNGVCTNIIHVHKCSLVYYGVSVLVLLLCILYHTYCIHTCKYTTYIYSRFLMQGF